MVGGEGLDMGAADVAHRQRIGLVAGRPGNSAAREEFGKARVGSKAAFAARRRIAALAAAVETAGFANQCEAERRGAAGAEPGRVEPAQFGDCKG